MMDGKVGVSGQKPVVAEAAIATGDGSGNIITSTYATKAEVGNIETALDGIIAIQNTLIGGGGYMSIADKLITIAENEQKVYHAGKQAEYNKFWDISKKMASEK